MRKSYYQLALCFALALRVVPAVAQGVELSIVKTIDILAGRSRPLAGQTNYSLLTAFNTRDGGCLELALAGERPAGAWTTPFLLCRFTVDGALLWSQGHTNFAISADAITEDDDGNVVFLGWQGSFTPPKFFQISPGGSVLNQLSVQERGVDLPYTHLIRFQDGFLAAGSRVDGFVFLKFSANLVAEWERRIPPISTTFSPVYPPCRALLAGPADDFLFSASGFLVRMNTNGVVEWARGLFGGTLAQVLRTRDGGYLMAGYGEHNARGDSDYLIVKANANGEHQWTRTFGGTPVGFVGGELLTAVAQSEDGGFLLLGRSDTEEISGNKGVQGVGCWLVKTDERGLKQGEMMLPEVVADASRLVRTGSGFALVGSRYREGSGSFGPQIYRWELSVSRRARISAHSLAGQPFNIDASPDLMTWFPVVIGFTGDLELRETIGSRNKFWRAYDATTAP